MNIKCSGNLTQNHARIHGPFKDIFLVSYTALFNKKRLRRSNDKIVHHNHCDEVGPIYLDKSSRFFGKRLDLSYKSSRLAQNDSLSCTKDSTVVVLHCNCIALLARQLVVLGGPRNAGPRLANIW